MEKEKVDTARPSATMLQATRPSEPQLARGGGSKSGFARLEGATCLPDRQARAPIRDLAVGGQALIEGVMIRSGHGITMAVRRPSGEIVVKNKPYISLTKRIGLFKIPVVRGMVMLIETIILGMEALNFSAEIAIEDESKQGEKEEKKLITFLVFGINFAVSIALAIFLFKFIPLWTTEQISKVWPAVLNSRLLFNVLDGCLRIGMFFLYIFILSRFSSFQRIFQYHGAEHQSIFAYEKGEELSIENVQKESPRHPRCGTSFIIIVLLVSIVLLTLVPRHPEFAINLLRRLSIIPLIMGVGYEVLKWTAKYQKNAVVRALTYPGILTQYITTKKPDDQQVEVALAAIKAATK